MRFIRPIHGESLDSAEGKERRADGPIGLITVLTVLFAVVAAVLLAAPSRSRPSAPRFEDIQPQSGIDFKQSIADGSGDYPFGVHFAHGSGVAAADIDQDGLIDLYFVNQMGSNRMYKNLGNGAFRDATAESGTGTSGMTYTSGVGVGAAFADYDNDGDEDLFVLRTARGTMLFENDGHGVFTDVARERGVRYEGNPGAAVFFDYDRDGWLDLLLVNVGDFDAPEKGGVKPTGFHHHTLTPGEPAILWRNNGGKSFTDVTKQTGIVLNNWNGAAAITDLNSDGFPDVYATSLGGDDRLLLNIEGKRFEDATNVYFPKTVWGSFGAKFFDYDNDSRFDLYVTDMHSDMVSSLAREHKDEKLRYEWIVRENLEDALKFGYDPNRWINGNGFFRNRGDGSFKEISGEIGAETYWPWGISVGDVDADGFEDVFLASGMGNQDPYQENVLLKNESGRRFIHKEQEYGIEPRRNGNVIAEFLASGGRTLSGTRSSRSAVIFDMDGDGDLDIVTNEWNDAPLVLRNDLAQRKYVSHIKIALQGTRSNRDGLGSVVSVEDSRGGTQYRYLDGNSGYFGFSQLPLYFGFPDGAAPRAIAIRWPSGATQTVIPPPGATSLTIVEKPD